jgi:hypothetical protein
VTKGKTKRANALFGRHFTRDASLLFRYKLCLFKSTGHLVIWAGRTGFYGSVPGGGWEIFLFTTASRTALGPIQPPIQWVPVALSLGVKRLEREADHSPPSSAEVKECVALYLHSPYTPSRHSA